MKKLFLVLLGSLIAMQSCKKEAIVEPPVSATSLKLVGIETMYEDGEKDKQTLTYDDQQRLISSEDEEDIVTVKYNGENIAITEFRKKENRVVFQFSGKLGTNGFLINGSATSNYTPNTVYQQQHLFEYDANGYLTQSTMSRDNGDVYTNYYQYDKGNVRTIEQHRNGVLQFSNEYTYETAAPNKTGFGQNGFLPVYNLTGRPNAAHWATYTLKRPGVEDKMTTAAYTKDANGYVVQQTITPYSGAPYIVNYAYE